MPYLTRFLDTEFFKNRQRKEYVAVFADAGAAARYKQTPRDLNISKAYIDKQRFDHSETPLPAELVGNVKGRHCLIIDDEAVSCNTAINDAELLKQKGALSVRLVVAHGILADKELNNDQFMVRINESPIEEIILTDSIPQKDKLEGQGKFTLVPIAPFLTEAVIRLINRRPLSVFHKYQELPKF
jgi:ribose-phosphate pyrophosphokinase